MRLRSQQPESQDKWDLRFKRISREELIMGRFTKSGKWDPEPTLGQLHRTQQEWEMIAGCPVDIEYIKGTFYGFCNELGALRLEHKYKAPNARAAFSKSHDSWFFSLEPKF
jgi:hypothetical protein